MWLRLAALFGMPVRTCQQTLSSAEFAEWYAYFQVEPFGADGDDRRMARMAAILANANRNTETHPQPFLEREFRLDVQPEPPQTEDDVERELLAWANRNQMEVQPCRQEAPEA
jgi:hypothetical protein